MYYFKCFRPEKSSRGQNRAGPKSAKPPVPLAEAAGLAPASPALKFPTVLEYRI
jgi:hypothetical protein